MVRPAVCRAENPSVALQVPPTDVDKHVADTWRNIVTRPRMHDDEGFTLLEVLTTCLLLGLLLSLGAGPWQSYRHTRAHIEARTELVAALRNAQVSAVSESVTYRVDFTAKKVITFRLNGGSAEQKRQFEIDDSIVTYDGPAFEDTGGLVGASVFFYPRGSASKGSVDVARDDRAKVYTVSVEGLTSRVSFTD